MSLSLREQHDLLLEQIPEGAIHDTEGCPFCSPDLSANSDGGGDMKTYTEDEFTTAVQEAVAPIQAAAEAKVNELQSELDGLKVTQAKGEAEGRIAELQVELDKAEINLTNANAKYDELVAYLESVEAAKVEAAAQEALRETRAAALAESTPLAQERIAEIVDRFIAMDDESFAALVEDYKTVSSASTKETEETSVDIPRETAMSNVRDENSSSKGYASVFAARNTGNDIRYI
jgi:hypothetical protein